MTPDLILSEADDKRLEQAATVGPSLGTSEQDKRILVALKATQQPVPVPSGEIKWKGDATAPLDQQWAEVSDQEHCGPGHDAEQRARYADHGRLGLALRERQSDPLPHESRRRLLQRPLGVGARQPDQERRQLTRCGNPARKCGSRGRPLFPSTYPWSTGGSMIQFHERAGAGSPPFGIGSFNGGIGIYRKNILGAGTGSAITRQVIAPKADPSKVYRFTLHAKFSEGSDGFVTVYLDGSTTPAYDYKGQFGFTTGYHPTHLRAGLYPGATSTPMDIFIGGMTWATTRAAAEANAFHA
jgi:hypothetical protein